MLSALPVPALQLDSEAVIEDVHSTAASSSMRADLSAKADGQHLYHPNERDKRATHSVQSSGDVDRTTVAANDTSLSDIHSDLQLILEFQRRRLREARKGANEYSTGQRPSSSPSSSEAAAVRSVGGKDSRVREAVAVATVSRSKGHNANDVEWEVSLAPALTSNAPNTAATTSPTKDGRRQKALHLEPYQRPLVPFVEADVHKAGRTFSPIFPNAQHTEKGGSSARYESLQQPPRPASAAAVFAPGSNGATPHIRGGFEGTPHYGQFLAQLLHQQQQHHEVLKQRTRESRVRARYHERRGLGREEGTGLDNGEGAGRPKGSHHPSRSARPQDHKDSSSCEDAGEDDDDDVKTEDYYYDRYYLYYQEQQEQQQRSSCKASEATADSGGFLSASRPLPPSRGRQLTDAAQKDGHDHPGSVSRTPVKWSQQTEHYRRQMRHRSPPLAMMPEHQQLEAAYISSRVGKPHRYHLPLQQQQRQRPAVVRSSGNERSATRSQSSGNHPHSLFDACLEESPISNGCHKRRHADHHLHHNHSNDSTVATGEAVVVAAATAAAAAAAAAPMPPTPAMNSPSTIPEEDTEGLTDPSLRHRMCTRQTHGHNGYSRPPVLYVNDQYKTTHAVEGRHHDSTSSGNDGRETAAAVRPEAKRPGGRIAAAARGAKELEHQHQHQQHQEEEEEEEPLAGGKCRSPVEAFADILNEEVKRNSVNGATPYAHRRRENRSWSEPSRASTEERDPQPPQRPYWGWATPIDAAGNNASRRKQRADSHGVAPPAAPHATAAARMAQAPIVVGSPAAAAAAAAAHQGLFLEEETSFADSPNHRRHHHRQPEPQATDKEGDPCGGGNPLVFTVSPCVQGDQNTSGALRGRSQHHHHRRSGRQPYGPLIRAKRSGSSLIPERGTITPRSGRTGGGRRGWSDSARGQRRSGSLTGRHAPARDAAGDEGGQRPFCRRRPPLNGAPVFIGRPYTTSAPHAAGRKQRSGSAVVLLDPGCSHHAGNTHGTQEEKHPPPQGRREDAPCREPKAPLNPHQEQPTRNGSVRAPLRRYHPEPHEHRPPKANRFERMSTTALIRGIQQLWAPPPRLAKGRRH